MTPPPTLDNFLVKIDATSYKNPCHCEERSDVAISR